MRNEVWNVKGVKSFEPLEICSLPQNDWLTPIQWSQPAYDCVQFVEEDTYKLLRFVQVTRAKTHSFKLKYMLQLLEKFNTMLGDQIKLLDVVVVNPYLTTLQNLPFVITNLEVAPFPCAVP